MLIRNEEGVRWLPVSLVAVAVVLAGYVVARRVLFHDTATQVTVDQVLERYRAESAEVADTAIERVTQTTLAAPTQPAAEQPPVAPPPVGGQTEAPPTVATAPPPTAAPAPQAVLPAPGVYQYATAGREYIDALGGTEHVYPEQTTVTVTPEGCGVRLRWDLLAERYEEWDLCLTADGTGVELQPTGTAYHQFYGQEQTDVAECQNAVQLSPAPEPGAVTARDCLLAGEDWQPVWTATGTTDVTIDGTTVTATTFDAAIEVEDPDYWEHSVQHWTIGPSGLPLMIEWDMSSRNPSPLGGTVYEETIEATLVGLHPLS